MKPTNSPGEIPANPGLPGEAFTARNFAPLVSEKAPSFDVLLDQICERLEDSHYQGSLRRIKKMEETLTVLERELGLILELSFRTEYSGLDGKE